MTIDSIEDVLYQNEANIPWSPMEIERMSSIEPGDLCVSLRECFGSKFELATEEQKLILVSIVSYVLFDGLRFMDACREWVEIEKYLPIEVIGSELNHSKGVELLRALAASLSDEHV